MGMRLAQCVAAPAVFPVSLDEAKRQLSIVTADTAYDELLKALIAAGTDAAEKRTGRQLVQAEYRLVFDAFAECMELPRPPLQRVTSITYLPEWGADPVELSASAYRVEADRLFGRILPVAPLPEAVEVVVDFVTGYPLDASGKATTPESIKHWIKVFVSTAFEHPEAFVPGRSIIKVPNSFVDGLLDTYMVEVFV
jgi:uncharacterized phiE125 gp8 family phage protein